MALGCGLNTVYRGEDGRFRCVFCRQVLPDAWEAAVQAEFPKAWAILQTRTREEARDGIGRAYNEGTLKAIQGRGA